MIQYTDSDPGARAPVQAGPAADPAQPAHRPGNPGGPLDLDWVRSVRVNRSAAEHRVASLGKRRSIKKRWQAGWLARAVTLIDLTTLAGDDTPGRVQRLCGKAVQPVRPDILDAIGIPVGDVRVGAVCVYHSLIETAVEALGSSDIPVAAVSTGFPDGLSPMGTRVSEIRESVEAGAREIDVVITRGLAIRGQWGALYDEVAAFRHACGPSKMKVILGTGDLGTLADVARASLVAMMAGADFIKTSTGKERINATLPVGLVMARMIRHYADKTGHRVGFKPAGGIGTAGDALAWMVLMKEELGGSWLAPGLFRFGASSLLADIERQLEHHATGRYSALHRHPLG